MTSDSVHLSDIANIQGGFAFKNSDFQSEGVAVVKIANIRPPFVSLANVDRVANKKLSNLDRFKLNDGDILMAMTGATVGKVGRFKETESAYLNQRVARINAKKGRQFDDFIYAVVSQPRFYRLIEGASAGSAQANISATGIGLVLIPRISDDDQLSIGKLARAIDDRITLLHETNTTLEAIAQALFKSWFVDFGPVRSKSEGKLPEGVDEYTAALFPDAFEESALGLIPTGWEVKAIGDVVDTLGGGTPDTKNNEYWEPPIHNWTTPKDLSGLTAPVLLKTERMLSNAGLAKVSSGLLPQGTLLMSSRAPIGYLAIAQTPIAINQGYIAIRPSSKLSTLFMLFWCNTNMKTIKSRANGSTFMEISKKAFRPIPIVVPPLEILDVFENLVQSLFLKIVENEKQIQSLTDIRDTLLPRLISGQLRVADDKEEIEKVSA